MKVKPLSDRVIIKALDPEEKTSGGIFIPDNAKEKPQRGKVEAVGSGISSEKSGEIIKMEVKTGDTVLYEKYSGTEVIISSDEYVIMRESDILAIM